MSYDFDVLIVGGGPTGLMMASQLQRYGITLRLIDRQENRVTESRAFGVQAKTMEIFQNLGLSEKFEAAAKARAQGIFFVNGKKRAVADLRILENFHTPFPQLYFIPQSVTEGILEDHLASHGVKVERQIELTGFKQENEGITFTLQNHITGQSEAGRCKYILGCDGAHSFVRTRLNIAFEGQPYEQQFVLADGVIDWPYGREDFMFFFSPAGMFIHARIDGVRSRLMGAKFGPSPTENPPPLEEIEELASLVTHHPVKITDCAWRSRFSLYHRAVKEYRKGRAFLAGDSAHIHTPVGAQGMNTGLQDATNLAWKLAWVIKGGAPKTLLGTYHTERHRIGEVLLNTTDKVFSLMTARGPVATPLRNFLLPLVLPLLFKVTCLRSRLFRFISQLAIHYHPSAVVKDVLDGADAAFLAGPKAGYRAPDAPLAKGMLFETLKGPEGHVFLFNIDNADIQKLGSGYLRFHVFPKAYENDMLFHRYGVTESAIYFVRPDGYIGFRSCGANTKALQAYLKQILPNAPSAPAA